MSQIKTTKIQCDEILHTRYQDGVRCGEIHIVDGDDLEKCRESALDYDWSFESGRDLCHRHSIG